METLDILVAEDKDIHQRSARQLEQLGHRVSIVGTFEDALRSLGPGALSSYLGDDPCNRFDVVLTDMHLPAGHLGIVGALSRDERLHDEYAPAPLGYAIALYAAKKGVPHIGIVSDGNHHTGPIAASFDLFKTGRKPDALTVGGSRLMLFDERDLDRIYARKDGSFCTEYPMGLSDAERSAQYLIEERSIVEAKNWSAALEELRKE